MSLHSSRLVLAMVAHTQTLRLRVTTNRNHADTVLLWTPYTNDCDWQLENRIGQNSPVSTNPKQPNSTPRVTFEGLINVHRVLVKLRVSKQAQSGCATRDEQYYRSPGQPGSAVMKVLAFCPTRYLAWSHCTRLEVCTT